jgi:hypothetical protein
VIQLEELEVMLFVGGTVLGLAGTALTFIVKFVKSAKAKRRAEQLAKIGDALIPYIEQAEKFTHYSGAEKKEYVLTKANRFAMEKGFEFNAAEAEAKLEELVALSRQVNARDKDKYASIANV